MAYISTRKIGRGFSDLLVFQQFDSFSHPLATIVDHSGSHLLEKYVDIVECETIIKSVPRLRNMFLDGLKHDFKRVWLLSKDLSVFR